MKGIFVLLGGLGDLEIRQLGNKTPLSAADTPNLDLLATRGELGYLYSVKPNYTPSSCEAVLSIFGNEVSNVPLSFIEAYGKNIEISRGDLVLFMDLVSIDSITKGNIIDRNVGKNLTSSERKEFEKLINSIKFPYDFKFYLNSESKGILVLKGNLSEEVGGNDLLYQKGNSLIEEKISNCFPLKKNTKAIESSEVINEFLYEVHKKLEISSFNKKRKNKGFFPINFFLIKSISSRKPKFKKYSKWCAISNSSFAKGFSKLSSMKTFHFKKIPSKSMDVYENLWKNFKRKIRYFQKIIKNNYKDFDYAFVYFKELDFASHDMKPFEKKHLIEYLDQTLFRFLFKFATSKNIKILVTGDHSTPCKLKRHSSDPVPILLYNGSLPKEKIIFNDENAKKGKLKRIMGNNLFKSTGFV